jgi:ribonuclease HI
VSAAPRRAFGVSDLAEFNEVMAELSADLRRPATVGEYVAYTDGACLGNPEGPGGWAAVVQPASSQPSEAEWLLWGHLSSTSNNRAEALGVLAALEWLPPDSRLALHSDSELTVRILQGRYKARANPDIWEVINRTRAEKRLHVQAEWVRGHAGDPRNELADRLSKLGAMHARNLDGLSAMLLEEEPARPARADAPELAGLEPRSDWEREFLKSVAKQLRGGRAMSPKQAAVIERMRTRSRAAEEQPS